MKEKNKLLIENISNTKELIKEYYKKRDSFHVINGKKYYYNIKNLFSTPFEREKDRVEIDEIYKSIKEKNSIQLWYEEAKNNTCIWWIENHIIAKHSFHSCMSCGICTSLCPAAEIYDFSPRELMELITEKNEEEIIRLLKSDYIWYCFQCGSCKTKCPRNNSPFGLVSSLRQLSQLKGYHLYSIRGRQQYTARFLWGGNLWNRGCTLYFRSADPERHADFGENYKSLYENIDEKFKEIGANPDMEGLFAGRKISPETLEEIRKLWVESGVLFFWIIIEEYAKKQALEWDMDLEEYLHKVSTEG
jgi:heterodisulfide reductase subunit C